MYLIIKPFKKNSAVRTTIRTILWDFMALKVDDIATYSGFQELPKVLDCSHTPAPRSESSRAVILILARKIAFGIGY
jgi:hypothetical protein